MNISIVDPSTGWFLITICLLTFTGANQAEWSRHSRTTLLLLMLMSTSTRTVRWYLRRPSSATRVGLPATRPPSTPRSPSLRRIISLSASPLATSSCIPTCKLFSLIILAYKVNGLKTNISKKLIKMGVLRTKMTIDCVSVMTDRSLVVRFTRGCRQSWRREFSWRGLPVATTRGSVLGQSSTWTRTPQSERRWTTPARSVLDISSVYAMVSFGSSLINCSLNMFLVKWRNYSHIVCAHRR